MGSDSEVPYLTMNQMFDFDMLASLSASKFSF